MSHHIIHINSYPPILIAGINGWISSTREIPSSKFLLSLDNKPSQPDKTNSTLPKPIKLPPTPPTIPVKKPSTTQKVPPRFDLTPEQEKNELYKQLRQNKDFPDKIPIQKTIGKLGLMWPTKFALDHQAEQLLLSAYAVHGCPVDCGPNWTCQHIELAFNRGPHISTKQKQAAQQLKIETADKIKHGYARIVK